MSLGQILRMHAHNCHRMMRSIAVSMRSSSLASSFSLCPTESRRLWETGSLNGLQWQRFYHRKKTVKIAPTKPLHFDYSGDVAKLPQMDLSQPRLGFEDCQELDNAEDSVKKIFSLEFADSNQHLEKRIADVLERVKEHPADIASLEVRIARQTVEVRNQIRHCLEFRKDKRNKSMLVERIQARKKNLRKLRALDYEKFEWLLSELQIKYSPVPDSHNPDEIRKPTRAEVRINAARQKMLDVKQAKVDAFRAKLEEEKKLFLDFKEKEMAELEKELKALGITDMESVDRTLELLGVPEYMPKKEKPKSRRQRLLEHKFELYKHRREGQS